MNRIEEGRAIQMLVESGKQFLPVFESRYLSVEIYKPEKEDFQLPQVRDDFYIIISGEGLFELEGKKSEFRKGDFFFVPAEADHRFVKFTDDFITWVFFVGPDGK